MSTYAQLNFLMPESVWASIENRSNTLQNHRLSILSSKLPRDTRGGRTKTRSFLFDPFKRLLANGNDEIRCTPEYILWPSKSVLKRWIWPFPFAAGELCRVSKRARTCKQFKFLQILITSYKFLQILTNSYKFLQILLNTTLYLVYIMNAMDVNMTSIIWQVRKAQGSKLLAMELE